MSAVLKDEEIEPIVSPTVSGSENPAVFVEPEITPPRRRPGRPKKSPDVKQEEIPGAAPKAKDTAAKPKKRSSAAIDLAAMGKQLAGLHLLAASITGIPELQITEGEGMALAQAVNNICDEYDLDIDGKTGAFIQLLATAGMVYMPRLLHVKARVKAAKESANVVPTN